MPPASGRDGDVISTTSAYQDRLSCPHRDRDTKGTEVKANGRQLAALKASVLMQKDITTQQKRETEQTDTQQEDAEELQMSRTVIRWQSASAVTEKRKRSLARSNVNEDADLSTWNLTAMCWFVLCDTNEIALCCRIVCLYWQFMLDRWMLICISTL